MSSALPWAGTAAIITASTTLLAQGHDGLAILIGLSGAVFLWATLLAPVSSAMTRRDITPADALAHSYASPALGTLVRLVLLLASALLLAADLQIAAAGLDLLFPGRGLGLMTAVAIVFAAGLVLPGIGDDRMDVLSAAAFSLLVVLVLTATAAMVWRHGPSALLAVPAIPDLAGIEQRLLEKRLADPAQFRAHTVPFLKTDAINFAALASIVGLGFAAAAISYGGLRGDTRANRRSALIVLALLILIPPIAANGKRDLMSAFDSGIKVASPPAWLNDHAAAGFLELCGKPPAKAADSPPRISDLCGKGFGKDGLLRWQDATYSREGLVYASLDASGAPRTAAAALLIAALLAGAVLASRSALVLGPMPGASNERTIAIGVTALAGLVAMLELGDVSSLLALAAGIAATGVIPAAIGAVATPARNTMGALLAVVIGIAIVAGLSLAPRIAPFAAYEASGAGTSAPPSIARRLATLREQSTAAPTGPARAWATLQARRIAEDRVTWLGLKPIASGIWGLAAGLAIILITGLISRRR